MTARPRVGRVRAALQTDIKEAVEKAAASQKPLTVPAASLRTAVQDAFKTLPMGIKHTTGKDEHATALASEVAALKQQLQAANERAAAFESACAITKDRLETVLAMAKGPLNLTDAAVDKLSAIVAAPRSSL